MSSPSEDVELATTRTLTELPAVKQDDEKTIETINRSESDEKKTPSEPEQVPATSAPAEPEYPPAPEGGLAAYSVVIGCACASFCSFGFANAFGVFQAYYQGTVPGATQSTIAWIGSLQYALIFFSGLPAGLLFDRGHFKLPLLIASCVLVAAVFLTAECTELYQLVLCQGFAIGLSAGFVFLQSLFVLPQWFEKKRGKAYGLVALGSSTGGTILPVVLRQLMDKVGFKWTVRILAFIILFLMIIFNLTVRRRIPFVKHNIPKAPIKDLLHNKPFLFYTASVTIIWFGFMNPLIFLDVSAQFIGVPASKSYFTLVCANGFSGIGRFSAGYLADYMGGMNVLIIFCFIAGITSIAWPYAHSLATLLVVAAIYGFSTGAYVSLMTSVVSFMVPRHQIGRAVGLSSTIPSMTALVGSPIAGQILIASGGFNAVGGYSGAFILVAVGLLIASRQAALGGKLHGKY